MKTKSDKSAKETEKENRRRVVRLRHLRAASGWSDALLVAVGLSPALLIFAIGTAAFLYDMTVGRPNGYLTMTRGLALGVVPICFVALYQGYLIRALCKQVAELQDSGVHELDNANKNEGMKSERNSEYASQQEDPELPIIRPSTEVAVSTR